MFGNLKNKLGDVADLKKYASPQILNSLTGSRQRSSQHTPGTQTPSLSGHSRQPSDASLTGATTSVPCNTLPEENNSSTLTTGYKGDVEQLERELEKLKNTLETQQDAALQRLNAKDQEWKKKLEDELQKNKKMEEDLVILKAKEEVLNKRILEKDKEIESLSKSADTEQKLIQVQDDYDQLEGLGKQEVSKVKHLLLNTTTELEKTKSELDEKVKEVKCLEKRLSSVESIEQRIHSLSEEKMDLETKVAGLVHKLNATNNRLALESEQHEEEVTHLKEKITMLEQRTIQDSCEDSEKTEAITKEREAYEHKLEESRLQLNNIKSCWGEKITALEGQIQNLNEKIAEDQVDYKECEKSRELLLQRIKDLEEMNKSAEETKEAEVTSLRNEVTRLQEDLETSAWQLKTESDKKVQEIKELRRNLHIQEEKSKQQTEEINTMKEHTSKLEENFKELQLSSSELETKNSALEAKYSSLQSSSNMLQEHLSRERASVAALEGELRATNEKYEVTLSEKTKLSSNLDKYLEKVNGLESTNGSLVEERESLNQRIRDYELELEDVRSRNESLANSVKELEADFDAKVESSCLVQELRNKLKSSEDEVTEKKQMLKVQAQRLADMKKTIQRELKINQDSSEVFSDSSISIPQLSPRLQPDSQKSFTNDAVFLKVKRTPSESQNGETDSINLEYLKNVILKFITSREYEAVQLTRVVSTLLHLTPEEENHLRDTLEWKMSWFSPKPHTSKGQKGRPALPSQ